MPIKILRHITLTSLLIWLGISLLVGILGYRYLAKLGWDDSVLNASMILGGMGPVDRIVTVEGKYFAAAYAIYCGAFFLVIFAVILDRVFALHSH